MRPLASGWLCSRLYVKHLGAIALLLAVPGAVRAQSTFVPPTPAPTVFTGAPAAVSDAGRFLIQASFGPTEDTLSQVEGAGIAHYIHQQIAKTPASSHVAYLNQIGVDPTQKDDNPSMEAWWAYAVTAPDQLRQRVAFALSEIFVVSEEEGILGQQPYAMSAYMDVLVNDAFGNYRQLLQDVTLNPAMGTYLNMLRNDKGNPNTGTHPNQNYGRESLQLFSIGLNELNPDGTLQLDASGQPIPTYTQATVDGFSQVYTGWSFAPPAGTAPSWYGTPQNWTQPMVSVSGHHDENTKKLLNGVVLPANGSAEGDLDAALDNIFNHPNVGPFFCRELIQRLVTSNPSPGYVYRVASVFNDNGKGVRGDLGAVVKAILTDFEARDPATAAGPAYGKEREPVIRLANVFRAFNATSPSGIFPIYNADSTLGQTPMRAPSVFNFFSPGYQPPGRLANQDLDAPEFEITSETTAISSANLMTSLIYGGLYQGPGKITIDISPVVALAGTPSKLVEYLNTLLMGGTMSSALRDTLVSTVNAISANDPVERARSAILLTVTSPAFVIQQ